MFRSKFRVALLAASILIAGCDSPDQKAQGYVDRLLAGEDYDKIYHEYQDLVAKEKAEAEAESNSGNSSAASSATNFFFAKTGKAFAIISLAFCPSSVLE